MKTTQRKSKNLEIQTTDRSEVESKMKYYTSRYHSTIWASVVVYALTILYLIGRLG